MEGPQPEDPLPEHINPAIGEGIANPQIWVLPQGSRRPVYRQVFLTKRTDATQAYQIIQPPAFQPVELSHGGPVWGYLFMGVILPRRPDLIYMEPPGQDVQRVAIKRLDLTVVTMELRNGSREDPYKEIWRMQTMGDDFHVIKLVEALMDDQFLYIITPWCDGGSLVDNIPLRRGGLSIEAQARILYAQMLEDLEYIHEVHGICHRDISPGNFLVSRNGRVLLTDLAMSFRIPPGGIVTDVGQFGKPPFWVPEILTRSPFDAGRCDLWACTLTLFCLVSGSRCLYKLPYPPDVLFRYCIMARGLSRDMFNEQVQEVVNEVQGEELLLVTAVAQRISTMSPPLRELFENTLHLFSDRRWTRQQVLECEWMNMEL
jgi:serine/threonine protein kinase